MGEAFDTWMDHYDRTGTEAVGFGLITLRRTSNPTPWLRVEELFQDFALPCGDAIAATFDRAAWLARLGDDREALIEELRAERVANAKVAAEVAQETEAAAWLEARRVEGVSDT